MPRYLIILLVFALAASATQAQDTNNDGLVQVLLPIAIPSTRTVPGAYGSVWAQELWVANNSATPFFALQPYGHCAPAPCTPTILPGGATTWFSMENNRMEGGALFALFPEQAAGIHLASRLLETSRRAQPNGIDIPMIREDRFFKQPSTFLGIPSGPGVRSRLRVYDPRRQRGSTVRVEILKSDGTVIGEAHLVPGDDPAINHNPFPAYPFPGFAVIGDLATAFPQVNNVNRYHVRVSPVTPGMEYWAFVAVTDVETQHLLLVTSQ